MVKNKDRIEGTSYLELAGVELEIRWASERHPMDPPNERSTEIVGVFVGDKDIAPLLSERVDGEILDKVADDIACGALDRWRDDYAAFEHERQREKDEGGRS